MDPVTILGAAAAASQFVDQGLKIAFFLYDLCSKAKEAPQAIRKQIVQIETLINIAKLIIQNPSLQEESVAAVLCPCLLAAQQFLELLKKIFITEDDGKVKKAQKIFSALLKEKEIALFFDDLEKQKTSIILCIDEINSKLLFSIGIQVAAIDSKLGEVSFVVNDIALVTNTTAVVANNLAKVLNDTALVIEEISIVSKDTAAVTSETALVVNDTARHMKTVTDVIPEFSGHFIEIRRDLDKLVKSNLTRRPTLQSVADLTSKDTNAKSHVLVPNRRVRGFLGREDVLAKIKEAFDSENDIDPPRVFVLRAMGGQGKTQVALEYCYRANKEKEFNTILWIDATSEHTLEKNFAAIAEHIRNSNQIQEQALGVDFVIRALMDWPERWLMVFDNYDDPNSFKKPLTDYIPRGEQGCVLVTSRHTIADDLAEPEYALELPPLEDNDALKLLLKQSGNKETETNLKEGRIIVESLGYHALAVTQAGSYIKLRKIPLSDFAVHYKRQRGAILQQKPQMTQYLKRLSDDDTETALNVFTTLELSFQQLRMSGLSGDREADVLTLLAFFDCKDISELLFKTFCSSLKMQKIGISGPGQGLHLFLNQKQRWDVDRYENAVVDLAQISLLQGWFRGSDGFCHVSLHPLVKDWILLRTDIDSFWKFHVIAAAIVAEVLSTSYDYEDFDLPLSVKQALLSHIDIHLEHGQFLKTDGGCLLRDKYNELQESEFWFSKMLCISDRYKEAEITSSRSFQWREKVLGPDHEMTLQSLYIVSEILAKANRNNDAIEVDRRLVKSCEKILGLDDQRTFKAYVNLFDHLAKIGEYEEAESIRKNHLLRTENVFGFESPENVDNLLSQGTYFELVKKYSEAREVFQQARDIQQKVFRIGHRWVIPTHTLLLLSIELERKHHDTGTLLQELLTAQKKGAGGSEQLESINSQLSEIALGLYQQERYGESEAIYRDFIERKNHSFSSLVDADILFWFGIVLKQQKKYEEAIEMYKSALDIEERLRGREHPKTLRALNCIVGASFLQAKDHQVEEYLGRMIDIKDKQLASHHPDTFNTLTMLSNLFKYLGDEAIGKPKAVRQNMYKQCEETLRCAIEIKEEELGPGHPDFLVSVQKLAQVLFSQDKLADAEDIRRKVVEIRSKHDGPDHQETIWAWYNLGHVLEARRKYLEAEECFKRCREAEIRRREGDKKLDSQRRLMKVLVAQGKYAEASAIFERFKGLDDAATTGVMYAFGDALFKEEKYLEAQEWFQRCYEAEVRRGEGDKGLASEVSLGSCLFRQKNYAAALNIYEKVVKKREKRLGPADSETISISLAVVNCLAYLGRYEDAVEVLRRVIRCEEDILGPESRKLIQSLEMLGGHLIMVKDYQGSADVYQRLIQLADKILGPEDRRTVASRQTLGDGPSSLAAIRVETLLVKSHPEYT